MQTTVLQAIQAITVIVASNIVSLIKKDEEFQKWYVISPLQCYRSKTLGSLGLISPSDSPRDILAAAAFRGK